MSKAALLQVLLMIILRPVELLCGLDLSDDALLVESVRALEIVPESHGGCPLLLVMVEYG